MIRFDNYPPTTPEDINMTQEGLTILSKADSRTQELARIASLRAYGVAIGATIFASLGDGATIADAKSFCSHVESTIARESTADVFQEVSLGISIGVGYSALERLKT